MDSLLQPPHTATRTGILSVLEGGLNGNHKDSKSYHHPYHRERWPVRTLRQCQQNHDQGFADWHDLDGARTLPRGSGSTSMGSATQRQRGPEQALDPETEGRYEQPEEQGLNLPYGERRVEPLIEQNTRVTYVTWTH